MNWELILRILAIVIPVLAAAPGIYAIRKQLIMEKAEKKKLIVEVESISADVAAKLIDSAGDIQEIYKEIFEEIKIQLNDNKVIVCRLEVEVKELKRGIRILTKQVRELDQIPRYPNGDEK